MQTILAATAVLWLPGRAIAEVLHCLNGRKPGIITSLGLSMAVTPLAVLLLSVTGIPLGRNALTCTYAVCAIAILMGCLRQRLLSPGQPVGSWSRKVLRNRKVAPGLLVIFATTLTLRFLQTWNLVLPSWVDSLHHTLIVQAIQEQGRIPDQLMAYAPIPFYYHFGFHVLAAAFGQLADLSAPQAVLVFGQILNAVTVLAVYHLAVELTHRPSVGVAAAILTGFVSQMPAYYASWGRYTMLAGMTLLPIAMAAAMRTWRAPTHLPRGLQLALLIGGLVLTHYLVAAYHFCFLLVLILIKAVNNRKPRWRRQAIVLCAWSGLGLVVVAPWIAKIFPYVIPFVRDQTLAGTVFSDSGAWFDRLGYLWHLANHARSWVILSLALPAVVTSFAHHSSARLLVAWVAILIALSNELLCQIQPFRADLLLICLFLPGNILAATALFRLRQFISHMTGSRLIPSVTLISILTALSAWGFVNTMSIINPTTVLTTPADVKALTWISENVPPNARFLINVEHWQYDIYQGTDGGWWIPILSQCETVLPPGVFYGWGSQRYVQEVKRIAEQVKKIDGCTPAFWRLVQEQDITHIYIGAKGGALQPVWFDTCPGVWRVYMGLNVHIYKIGEVPPRLRD